MLCIGLACTVGSQSEKRNNNTKTILSSILQRLDY